VAAFEPVSDVVGKAAADPARRVTFRHGGMMSIDGGGDDLLVCYSRIGDAPERLIWTRVNASGDPKTWTATPPRVLLEPERDYEGAKQPVVASTFMGQTNVRQLRDPSFFRDGETTYLLYAVAGETGIGLAKLTLPASMRRGN
jgi:hypothetical protein